MARRMLRLLSTSVSTQNLEPTSFWSTLMRRISTVFFLAACAGCFLASQLAQAAVITIAPLSTWSPNNDGWLAPGEGGYAYLGTGNNERGLAYGNGHVYLTSRTSVNSIATNVRILNPTTGADAGALDTTGVTGGIFTINTAAVNSDGSIYVNNLTTASTATGAGQYKVYRWATEASTPTTAYAGDGGL